MNYINTNLKYKEGDLVKFLDPNMKSELYKVVVVDIDIGTDYNYRLERIKDKDRIWAREEQIEPATDFEIAINKYNI